VSFVFLTVTVEPDISSDTTESGRKRMALLTDLVEVEADVETLEEDLTDGGGAKRDVVSCEVVAAARR
jgi:hypothetical protein